MALGAALVAYAVLGLSEVNVAVPLAWEPWLSAPVGAVTGIVAANTGAFVIPAVPFLGALGLEKDDLVQALGLSFTSSTLALGGSLFFDGALQASLGASLLALIPAAIGMLVGQRLRDRVDPATFRRYFFLGLLGLGVDPLARRLFYSTDCLPFLFFPLNAWSRLLSTCLTRRPYAAAPSTGALSVSSWARS